jgi:hypothetical protein
MMFVLVHLLSRLPKVCEKGNANMLKYQVVTGKGVKRKI